MLKGVSYSLREVTFARSDTLASQSRVQFSCKTVDSQTIRPCLTQCLVLLMATVEVAQLQ